MEKTYESIITTALDSDNSLSDLPTIKNEIDIITENVKTSWAPLKATVASLVAKIKYPEWDTRNHQRQLRGLHSLRSIDVKVCKFLYSQELYNSPTAFALTRSFEKAEPFHKNYSGQISPKKCKSAFLNIVEIINTTTIPINPILTYILAFLKRRKESNTILQICPIGSCKEIDIRTVSTIVDKLINLGSGSSVVPPIIVHTLLSIVQPYLWPTITIKQLKEHTAPDNHSKSYGDIEGMDSSKPKIAIEVKHKIPIDDTIIKIFDEKTKDEDIPLKFIITTASTEKKVVHNIFIDTLDGFVISYLHQTLFHEKSICLLFMKELRKQIVIYKNISIEIKQSVHDIITVFLDSPSL